MVNLSYKFRSKTTEKHFVANWIDHIVTIVLMNTIIEGEKNEKEQNV